MSNPIGAARFKLAYERPYLASAIWALIPVETPGLGTLAVDKYWRLYFDPDVDKKWNVNELCAILYHEINHLLRDHPERGEGKDPQDFNVAADAAINDDIVAERALPLPNDCVLPSTFGEKDGGIEEAYYEAIQKKKKKEGNKKGDGPGKGKPKKDGQPAPGSGKCGSAANGQDAPWEKGKPTDQDPGMKPGEADLKKKEVAKDIQEASKSRGDVPGHLTRWADVKLKEKVDWRKTLATYLRNCINHVSGANDYTFKRISRRSAGDIVMPATIQPIPNIAVVVDTSGSMGSQQIASAITEVGGILKAQGARDGVTVLAVDAQVHTCKKVFKADQVNLKGGGGTDMGVGLVAASKLKPKPDICVVITDGETGWPAKKPPISRIIVCIVPTGWRGRDKGPDYAKTIMVEDEDE